MQGEAERWEETEEGRKEFSPSAVRKRLGRESFDEVYGHFSESGHPRFAAARLGAYGKREEGSEDMSIVIPIGPFLLDESPEQWFLAMFLTSPSACCPRALVGSVTSGGSSSPSGKRARLKTSERSMR